MPRKLRKPVTPVTVVRMIEDDCAGACPSTVSTSRDRDADDSVT